MAQWQVEPWGGMEWERHAAQMNVLDSILAIVANKGLHPGHKDWNNRYKARKIVDFMPGDYHHEQSSKPKVSQGGFDELRKRFEGQ